MLMASMSDSETTNRGSMWELDQNLDQPMDEEASQLKNMYREKKFSSILLLRLAFQSLGVVFGDLGGTFALYSLLCRHAKVSTIPNQHKTDEELTTYSRQTYEENSLAAKVKKWLEGHAYKKNCLLILVLIGTCTAIGDGILTPAISVLSAAGGIRVQNQNMSTDVVVIVAVFILIGLFCMQHYGTDKVGWLFAPLVLLWFILIGSVGLVNIHKYNSSVLRAYNPVYTFRYFKRGKSEIWTSLGGVMLSITGTEALYADLCHFPVLAIQAAYIIDHKDHVVDAFYRSIPEAIYWPAFVIATLAAVVASQATISATYSIIKQALALGCFPRVNVVHTSKKFLGQIYIPDINWVLMILCIAVTAGFKNQSQIGNAYGTAVVIVMLVTTFLMVPVMLLVWKSHWILVVIFLVLSLTVELPYFTACINKVDQGGWVPLVIIITFFVIMAKPWPYQGPWIGFVYTELASGVPHIFSHFITNLPAIHSVVVFALRKYLPVYTVPAEERFIMKRIGPKNYHMFRCVARYGYKDIHKKDDNFEKMLLDRLLIFVRLESMMDLPSDSEDFTMMEQKAERSTRSLQLTDKAGGNTMSSIGDLSYSSQDSIIPAKSPLTGNSLTRYSSQTFGDELEFLNRCKDAKASCTSSNTVVLARRDSGIVKKVAVNYVYAFLRKLCRENSVIFNVPHESLLNVGQIYYI
ncbi:unnamed protein product [Miscanthus lutarioriparius]|uniref:Potassium transporter n=1 Tax=Miscanthus lutarioriparius TaxID=422564 RepID=A0A811SIW7_9POAL|nr:unnamed protein product [Miscanthus lutarioriparius]